MCTYILKITPGYSDGVQGLTCGGVLGNPGEVRLGGGGAFPRGVGAGVVEGSSASL